MLSYYISKENKIMTAIETLPFQDEEISSKENLVKELQPHEQFHLARELVTHGKSELAAVIQVCDIDGAAEFEIEDTPVDKLVLLDLRSIQRDSDDMGFNFESHRFSGDVQYLLIDPSSLDLDNGIGYKGLRFGESYIYGKSTEENINRFVNTSTITSRKHFEVSIDNEGGINITDLGSSNGTTIYTGEKAHEFQSQDYYKNHRNSKNAGKLSTAALFDQDAIQKSNTTEKIREVPKPNYKKAIEVNSDELWRYEGNEGKPLDQDYIRNYTKVRQHFVEAFKTGELYESYATFLAVLKNEHQFIGNSGNYNRLNDDRKIDNNELGEFRSREWSRPTNLRIIASRKVAKIATDYNDGYGSNGRFVSGKPNLNNISFVYLLGIDDEYLSYDEVQYDETGKIKEIIESSDESGYKYYYPPAEGIDQYMRMYQEIGSQIHNLVEEGISEKNTILDLIAIQYQYAAIARPFPQINNSLFMEVVNMQIKMLGFEGISHGHLDLLAQRIQPEYFSKYFIDVVNGRVSNQ